MIFLNIKSIIESAIIKYLIVLEKIATFDLYILIIHLPILNFT